MSSTHCYRTTTTARARPRKQFPQIRKTVKLSVQVQKVITAEQKAKWEAFDVNVAGIWQDNLEACEKLAVKHHKTSQKCQDAVFLGAKLKTGSHKKISKWKAFIAAMVKDIKKSTYI